MPLVAMRVLLDHAAENGYGLAAFNVNNMEQIQSIMEAAEETDSPVIVQASRGARKLLPRQLPPPSDDRRRGALSARFRSPCTRTTATARRRARARSTTASRA